MLWHVFLILPVSWLRWKFSDQEASKERRVGRATSPAKQGDLHRPGGHCLEMTWNRYRKARKDETTMRSHVINRQQNLCQVISHWSSAPRNPKRLLCVWDFVRCSFWNFWKLLPAYDTTYLSTVQERTILRMITRMGLLDIFEETHSATNEG